MNAPPLQVRYIPDFLEDPSEVFWPVLHELLTGDPQIAEIPGRLSRTRSTMERHSRSERIQRLVGTMAGRLQAMSTHVAMVGGRIWHKLNRLPDYASVALYRDHRDFAGWHVDYEPLAGPAVGDCVVAIVSLGARREMQWSRIPRAPLSEPVIEQAQVLETGSLLLMQGDMQRHFMHRLVARDDECGPRISLTYTFEAPEVTEESPWILVEGDLEDGTIPMPIIVAPREEVMAYWDDLIERRLVPDGHKIQLAGPDLSAIYRNYEEAVQGMAERDPDERVAQRLVSSVFAHRDRMSAVHLEKLQDLARNELRMRDIISSRTQDD